MLTRKNGVRFLLGHGFAIRACFCTVKFWRQLYRHPQILWTWFRNMRMVLHCGMLTSAVAPSTNIIDMILPYAYGFALWKMRHLPQHDKLTHYLSLLTRQTPIESQFISRMTDNLNAEVTSATNAKVLLPASTFKCGLQNSLLDIHITKIFTSHAIFYLIWSTIFLYDFW